MNTTQQKLYHKLTKMRTTINNHIKRGYRLGSSRSHDLVDRYHDLKAEAQDADVWNTWCQDQGFCPTHDAYDYWA